MAQWREWMDGRDSSSVASQVERMMWDDAAFQVVNECLRLAERDEKGRGVKINGLLAQFIFRCYVDSQLLAVRRLVENSHHSDRSVVSLRRVLDDLKGSARLLRRKDYFDFRKLPYDADAAKRKAWSEVPIPRGGGRAAVSDIDGSYRQSYVLHETIDRLARVKPSNRTEQDTVDARIFSSLISMLGGCDRLKMHVNKYLAHAAAPTSRESVPEHLRSLTLEHLWQAHKAICEVTAFVRTNVLMLPLRPTMPLPTFGHLRHLDKPWIRTGDMPKVEAFWRRHVTKVDGWSGSKWPKGW
jgi:hypothetical protein